jgi:hypothetical protein
MRLVLVALALVASACRNACQDTCKSMSEYAIECGFTVSDADLDACYSRQANPDGDDARSCRDLGDLESLRNQWTCDDVSLYFAAGGES